MTDEEVRQWLEEHPGKLFCTCEPKRPFRRVALVMVAALIALGFTKAGAVWARTHTNELEIDAAAAIAVESDPASAKVALVRLRFFADLSIRALLESSRRDDDVARDAAIALHELRRLLYHGR